MRIPHGHGQAGMTQDFLQGEDVTAALDEVAGEGVRSAWAAGRWNGLHHPQQRERMPVD